MEELLDQTGGDGPEWRTLEWILAEIIRARPITQVHVVNRATAYLDLVDQVKRKDELP